MWTQDIFKQNNALELFISLKIAISCCFGLRGNLDFPHFFQKKFYNINYRSSFSLILWFPMQFVEPEPHFTQNLNLAKIFTAE